mmetsp:Transcript_112849/g.195918  ORF Transcript_112849/g.195918 Transcript_112849/m.195918 type:complete len:84 (+) Transcript_112849:300-551(+)
MSVWAEDAVFCSPAPLGQPAIHPSIVIYWPKMQYRSVLESALHPFFQSGTPPPSPRRRNKDPHACPDQHQFYAVVHVASSKAK